MWAMAAERDSPEGSTSARAAAIGAVKPDAPKRRRPVRTKAQLDAFVTFDALPAHQRDNRYILRYYRSGYGFKRSLRSLFSLHNETGNIWTHLIGAYGVDAVSVGWVYGIGPEPGCWCRDREWLPLRSLYEEWTCMPALACVNGGTYGSQCSFCADGGLHAGRVWHGRVRVLFPVSAPLVAGCWSDGSGFGGHGSGGGGGMGVPGTRWR